MRWDFAERKELGMCSNRPSWWKHLSLAIRHSLSPPPSWFEGSIGPCHCDAWKRRKLAATGCGRQWLLNHLSHLASLSLSLSMSLNLSLSISRSFSQYFYFSLYLSLGYGFVASRSAGLVAVWYDLVRLTDQDQQDACISSWVLSDATWKSRSGGQHCISCLWIRLLLFCFCLDLACT